MGNDGEKAVSHLKFFHKKTPFPKAENRPDNGRQKQCIQQQERPPEPERLRDAEGLLRGFSAVPSAEDIGTLLLEDVAPGTDVFRQADKASFRPLSIVKAVPVMDKALQREIP